MVGLIAVVIITAVAALGTQLNGLFTTSPTPCPERRRPDAPSAAPAHRSCSTAAPGSPRRQQEAVSERRGRHGERASSATAGPPPSSSPSSSRCSSLLVLGIAEFGRAYQVQTTLSAAAREGVRVMALQNDAWPAREPPSERYATSLNPTITDAEITVTPATLPVTTAPAPTATPRSPSPTPCPSSPASSVPTSPSPGRGPCDATADPGRARRESSVTVATRPAHRADPRLRRHLRRHRPLYAERQQLQIAADAAALAVAQDCARGTCGDMLATAADMVVANVDDEDVGGQVVTPGLTPASERHRRPAARPRALVRAGPRRTTRPTSRPPPRSRWGGPTGGTAVLPLDLLLVRVRGPDRRRSCRRAPRARTILRPGLKYDRRRLALHRPVAATSSRAASAGSDDSGHLPDHQRDRRPRSSAPTRATPCRRGARTTDFTGSCERRRSCCRSSTATGGHRQQRLVPRLRLRRLHAHRLLLRPRQRLCGSPSLQAATPAASPATSLASSTCPTPSATAPAPPTSAPPSSD